MWNEVRNNPKLLTADNADYADKFIRSKSSIWTQTHDYLGHPLHSRYPRCVPPRQPDPGLTSLAQFFPALSAPPPIDGFKNSELIGEQAFVAARAIVPVAPVNATLVAPKDPRVGESDA